MKKLMIVALILSVIPLTACRPKWNPQDRQSYVLGQIQEVSVGNPMLTKQSESVVDTNERTGYAFSPTGYVQRIQTFTQELIYSGRVDNSLKLNYREYIDDISRMSYHQDLQYDLDESKTIAFKDFEIEILDATNSKVSFKVVSD